jgi:hypothetical protein
MEDVLDCLKAPFFALIDFTLDTPVGALALGTLLAGAATLLVAGW